MSGLIDGLPAGTLQLMAGYAALLVVPGPNMVVVSASSLASRGGEGMAAAIGVAFGATLLALVAMYAGNRIGEAADLGLFAPLLFAATMLYLGLRLVSQAIRPSDPRVAPAGGAIGGHLLAGLVTSLSNPISFAFFSTAAISLADSGSRLLIAAPACVFTMALGWFLLVGWIASRAAARGVPPYLGATVRGIAGAALLAIAVWTLLDALNSGG